MKSRRPSKAHRWASFLLLTALPALQLFAQRPPEFSDEVREFIRVDAPVVVLRHVRIIDGTGAPAKADQTVFISNGVIQSVGADHDFAIPGGAEVLDLEGFSVLPGLIMLHEHLFYPSGIRVGRFPVASDHGFSFPRLYLAAGVTTIRTAGTLNGYTDLNVRDRIEAGHLVGLRKM